MTKTKIVINTIAKVKDFVNKVMKYDFEVDLSSGRYSVDAKSIMGIFSLDLENPVDLTAHTDDASDFLKDIEEFIAK